MRVKVYVGTRPNLNREVFRSTTAPTEKSHGGRYVSVTGPFRTVRGARFMSDCENNPHIVTVGDAERAAKAFADADRGELRRAMAYVRSLPMLERCKRCIGRGYLPEKRKPSKRNPHALGFYARTCPKCGGRGSMETHKQPTGTTAG